MMGLSLALFPFMVWAEKPVTYLNAMPDIPVMHGLVEGAGSTLSFDKPSGRILSTYVLAEDFISEQDILDFYQKTLPQLGWTEKKAHEFIREREQLSITVDDGEDGLIVQFLLTPVTK